MAELSAANVGIYAVDSCMLLCNTLKGPVLQALQCMSQDGDRHETMCSVVGRLTFASLRKTTNVALTVL